MRLTVRNEFEEEAVEILEEFRKRQENVKGKRKGGEFRESDTKI